jgi:hypothetical protein
VDPGDLQAITAAVDAVLVAAPTSKSSSRRPELWDGHAGERIVATIAEWARMEDTRWP